MQKITLTLFFTFLTIFMFGQKTTRGAVISSPLNVVHSQGTFQSHLQKIDNYLCLTLNNDAELSDNEEQVPKCHTAGTTKNALLPLDLRKQEAAEDAKFYLDITSDNVY